MRYYSSTATPKTLSALLSDSSSTMQLSDLTGLPTSYPYTLVVDPDIASEEIVLVTGLSSGTTVNITRGTDTYLGIAGGNGTSKQAHSNGAVVKHMVTARDLQEPQTHMAATSGVHGVTGDIVGSSAPQTLTNKTINSVSNTITIAQGSVTNLTSDLAAKAPSASPTFTGTVVLPSTTSIGNVDSTEIGYLDGVTSSIQTQLSNKAPTYSPTFGGTVSLPSATTIGNVSSTELGYLDGVTSAIQAQIDNKTKVQSGSTSVTYSSGTGSGPVTSATTTASSIIVATSADNSVTASVTSVGTNTFTISVRHVSSASGSATVRWMVI